jgi:hypothetical protein
MLRSGRLLLVVVLMFCSVGLGAPVTDAAGDFLATYTGPQNPDMDVVSAEVILDIINSTLTFNATMSGPVGTTPAPAVYFFGVDRGAGTPGFGGDTSFAPGIVFDTTVQFRADGSVKVNDRSTGVNKTLPSGSMVITGNTIASVDLPLSLFPSNGFTPEQYTWNFWPRSGTGQNYQVADFVLEGGSSAVTVIPEPCSLALVGLGAVGLLRKRRA